METHSQASKQKGEKEKKHIKVFHTVLGFRLIKLPEGVDNDLVSVTTPSGIFFDQPVVTYIINK